uniref:Transcription elongation factor SPT6 n=1 Tax=Cacopsylla melanoneura TaxID=428564 RepID=A0A8D8RJL4_9HEMI
MADFIDSEAEESEEEEELNDQERKKSKRLKMESSDEDEDDEDKLREELEDLIDDAPIEEDDDESDDENRKRKISDDELDDRLEDDDYDLIEENLGMKVQRKKQFKRLKRIEDDESDDDGNEQEGNARDMIANELFDSGDEDADRSSERRSAVDHTEAPEFEEGEGDDYSDADDFIVDDHDKPISSGKKKKAPIFSDAALQEAQDIFGVEFDYDEFDRFEEDEDYSDDDEDDEYLDEEAEDDPSRRKKKKQRRKVHKKSIFEIYEPSELKRGHFTDLDNEIRSADIPERMQLREVPVTAVPEGSDELDEESKWIYNQVYAKPSVSTQDSEGGADPRTKSKKGPQTIGKIKKALDFMRNQQLEVPFIAFYRKEYVLPELTISDLWKVYKYDAKWCQLKSRKTSLQKLYENMRDYQNELLTKDLDAPIPDDVRLVRDEDIEWIKKIQTPEEVKDMQHHFFLYYAHEIPAMQEFVRRKAREARLAMPKEKKKKLKTITNDEGDEEEVEVTDDEDDGENNNNNKEVEEESPETVKPANRCGPYSLCRKAKIIGFAKRFGLTPEQFGEHLRDNYQRHDLDQEPVGPLDLAKEYITPKFTLADDVLKAGKFVVSTQLSREPLVVKCVREILFERAKISVTPTKRGLKEIDESHPIYTMKYLTDKPVRDLVADQYLKLHIAEEDRLIVISVCEDLKGLTSTLYMDEVKQLYYRDEFSKYVQDWNAVRADVVETALKRMILPELYKELKTALLTEAKENVLKRCAGKLYDWIKVAPVSVDIDDEEWTNPEEGGGVRVMGVAYEPDLGQAAFAGLCAPDGECVEFLRLPNLLRRRMSNWENEKLLKESDLLALRNFINSKKPHVIAVSGESREAIMIQKDLEGIIKQLGEDEEFPEVKVEIVDNEFSKIYANSLKGESDFKEYPVLLRQAISLARRLQDPLMEFSQLCTSDDEIMCLRYHPLQDNVSKEELLDVITLEFVNRTNEVGVDLNEIVQNPYTSNLVQFICGLGPRKGAALVKLMKQTNLRLENRTLLVTKCHMGPKVFINCAGFIKIDTDSLGSTDAYVEVLDGSRVHPETYEWARKMAVDALEYDDEDTNPAGALEEILKAPDRLKDLDLDAFAEELERQGFGNKSITLYDIRAELSCRYKDLRSPYVSVNTEQLFDMLTKETPESLYIGKMVMATVTGFTHKKPTEEQLNKANPNRNDETGLWQCPFCLKNDFPELSEVWNHFDAGGCPGQATGVRIRLDNGITGYIHIKKLSDSEVTSPEDRVQRGQTIHCRIIKIDTERFYVEATSRTSDLNDDNGEWRPPKDPYYDHAVEKKDKKTEEDSKKIKQRQQYVKRVIVHPAFHNISYVEAEKWMKTMDQGEVIVRPSSKGADHLTVTWKVADDLYQHIDVREEGKENSFSLGRSLWIGTEEFEDLDEIIARHVSPMAANVRELLSFRYYKEECAGMRDKAEEVLRAEKRNNPNKIHYFVSLSRNYPGKFLLSYLPATRSRHEFISVTPDGFRFRGQNFDSVNQLFRWFKEHFRDPIPGAGAGAQTPGGGYNTARATPGHLPYHTPAGLTPHHRGMPTPLGHHNAPMALHPPTVGAYGYPNTPYTPSGQTPFLTPYHPVTATPRAGTGGAGPFATPRPVSGAHGPGYATKSPAPYGAGAPYGSKSPAPYGGAPPYGSKSPAPYGGASGRQHQTSASSSREFNSRSSSHGNVPADPNAWRKAAEEWAKAAKGPSSGSSVRSTPRYDGGSGSRRDRVAHAPRPGPGSYRASPAPSAASAPSPSASPAFSMRSAASARGGAGPHHQQQQQAMDMSPYSPRTPRTIASPRSMVESSIGEDMATPLYDE